MIREGSPRVSRLDVLGTCTCACSLSTYFKSAGTRSLLRWEGLVDLAWIELWKRSLRRWSGARYGFRIAFPPRSLTIAGDGILTLVFLIVTGRFSRHSAKWPMPTR